MQYSPLLPPRRSLGRVSVPMWPVTLSGRLLIVALVGRYPANWLIRRGSISHHRSFFTPYHAVLCAYAVLAVISNCYPQCEAGYPRVTHPSATQSIKFHPKTSFNCFVRLALLGTPPAFILSQDQTLMLKVDSRFQTTLAWL